MHRLDLTQARRIAVRAQLLAAERPPDLLTTVERLTLLQIDPTAAIAPNADLVAWSRLGAVYRPEHLTAALERERTLFEFNAMIRPTSDLALYLPEMAAWPELDRYREWLDANASFRADVLARLRAEGPLQSRDIPDTATAPWVSTGWTNDRNVTQMLDFLAMRGEVAIAGRVGRQRLWDLAERVFPPRMPVLSRAEARRTREERRLRSLGISRPNVQGTAAEPGAVGTAGEEAVVEGLPGVWRVDPEALGQPFAGRTALLSPFDRLIHDRKRLGELFGFEYVLEMYKPKDARRWGYFALPVLHHDRLVGKVDATADRKAGVLRVDAVHEDVPFTKATAAAVRRELAGLASWLGLEAGGPAFAATGRR